MSQFGTPVLGKATGVLKTSPGYLTSFKAHNRNSGTRWLQLFDSTTAPSGGATPLDQWEVPASGIAVIGEDYFTKDGMQFKTGIAWGFSTTAGTFTAGTDADHDFSGSIVG